MRYCPLTLIIFLFCFGCKEGSNSVSSSTLPTTMASRIDANINYIFTVPKLEYGSQDTLTATLTVTNLTTTAETLGVNQGWLFWSLTDSAQRIILSGPRIISWNVIKEALLPNKSLLIGAMNALLTDTLGRPIPAGTYQLNADGYGDWRFSVPLSIDISIR